MQRLPRLLGLALFASGQLFAQSSPAGSATAITATAVAAAIAGASNAPFQLPAPSGDIRLINLSTRAQVSAGNSLVTGFAISGTAPRPVLVRAVGPGLAGFGVGGVLATPRLELRSTDGTVLAENNGWTGELAPTFAAAGAFPFAPGSADSAAIAVLPPGTYTMQVSDRPDGAGGVVLAEVYDLGDARTDSRLINVSSLTTVTTGTISGFILSGTGRKNFLVRGVGPGLTRFGVDGVLVDPKVTLYDGSGESLGTNNDWSGSRQVTAIAAGALTAQENAARVDLAAARSGAFPLERFSNDAAMVVTLTPGVYTVEVSGIPTLNGVTAIVTPTAVSASGAAAAAAVSGQLAAAAQAVAIAAAQGASAAPTGSVGPATQTNILQPARPGVALLEIYELP